MRATALLAVAFVVISCKTKLKTTAGTNFVNAPVQVVENMFVVQSENSRMKMRVSAPKMERYQNDSLGWELFPDGFLIHAYDESGALETEIKARFARHDKPKIGQELWMAYGGVRVTNLIRHQKMESDTLFWDPDGERIYTHCYVRLTAPTAFMQGYGMESDQRARCSVITRPFNSYSIMNSDSTKIEIDTVNFIGPLQEK